MKPIHIDPGGGPHSAAELSNEVLEYLFELVLWELAIRTSREQFEQCLANATAQRARSEEVIQELRRQRDLMCFAAEVMRDIQLLPGTDESAAPPSTGMYL